MVEIYILVTDRCQASSIYTAVDLLVAANYAAQTYCGAEQPPFSFTLVGAGPRAHAFNGTVLSPLSTMEGLDPPDVFLVPGVLEATADQRVAVAFLARYDEVCRKMQEWHAQGCIVASACTGNLLVAAADVLQDRPITCHWASHALAESLFPEVEFSMQQLLIDHNDIVSAGGATAVSQLVLYLVKRFASREAALATAKLMLIEMNQTPQSRFAMFKGNREHKDLKVLALQDEIESEHARPLDLHNYCLKAGISPRQLSRRFKKATGETPLSYLQKVRLEAVKVGLETSREPINSLIWKSGYEDSASFRRLFKKSIGLTMAEYRKRFSS